MTSGNIQMGPDPDRILDALKDLLREDPGARQRPVEEVSKELVSGGHLQEEPDPVLVAEMLEGLEAEQDSLRAAVERLMEAQREALDATNRALDAEGLNEEELSDRLEGALVDVRDILEGALEDTQDTLEGEA